MSASDSLLSREIERPRSFVAVRLEKMRFETKAQFKSAAYELSALFDADRVEISVDRVQGELLIGVKERRA